MARRRGWLVVLCAVIAGAAAFGLSEAQTKQYTATASLIFNTQDVAQQASGVQVTGTSDPTGQRATNVLLVQLPQSVANQAANTVGGGVSAKDIRGAISVTPQGSSNIVSVAATWPNAARAAQIANAFTNAFVQEQSRINQAAVQNAVALVEQQLNSLPAAEKATTQGQSLEDRLESLKILKSLQSDARVVQAAEIPTSPSSPKTGLNVLFGVVLGFILGIGLALQVERLDQRLREPAEIENLFGLPVLGVVPHGHTRAMARGNIASQAELEPFRMLRSYLRYFNVDRELQVLLVASADPGEGKTTVSRGLAGAAASLGTRTLLIEADLRRPVLAEALGVSSGIGLTGALVTPHRVQEAVQQLDIGEHDNGGAPAHTLDVMPAGAVPPNPAELIDSHAMENTLLWARDRYDLVVLDTAPISVVSDSIPLMNAVDGVIIVSRVGRSRRDHSGAVNNRLRNLNAPVLGIVVNDAKQRRGGSYYGYGYGDPRYAVQANDSHAAGDNGTTDTSSPSTGQAEVGNQAALVPRPLEPTGERAEAVRSVHSPGRDRPGGSVSDELASAGDGSVPSLRHDNSPIGSRHRGGSNGPMIDRDRLPPPPLGTGTAGHSSEARSSKVQRMLRGWLLRDSRHRPR